MIAHTFLLISPGFVIGMIFGMPYDKSKSKSLLAKYSYELCWATIILILYNLKELCIFIQNNLDLSIYIICGLFLGFIIGYITMVTNQKKFS